VISEETGGISICHRRRIERDFTPETFRKRIGEILLQSSMMKKLILKNWQAKIISLLLASTLWYLIKKNVATTPSPSEETATPASKRDSSLHLDVGGDEVQTPPPIE
jgi:hypothetical protein